MAGYEATTEQRVAIAREKREALLDEMIVALRKALPILCGLVAQQGLDPAILGYESGGWVAKEAVKDALDHAKEVPRREG